MKEIEIIKPDDWHVHFRDNKILEAVVPETTRNFARAIVMPNLIPPILNGGQAVQYQKRIENAVPNSDYFLPFMTIYLTETTKKNELRDAFINGDVFAAKLYPAGATTNSESGVKNINNIMPLLEVMSEIGMPLLLHGETTSKEVDIFDREKVFIEETLDLICKRFPNLTITLEHITTEDAISYICEGNENLGASITPHHLAMNRNAIFNGGIRPHNYCLPILKREKHRKSLIKIATSGNKKFFLGTDTAPHFSIDKESECGCAGIFNATYCISILAQIFENENTINKLQNFTSINGATHYNLNINKEKIKLIKRNEPIKFKQKLIVENKDIYIFEPDFPVYWEVI